MRSYPILFLALAACGGGQTLPGEGPTADTGTDDKGNTGLGVPEYIGCSDTETPLGASDASPLGFSADEVVAGIAGPLTAVATWAERDGSPTVSFTVTAAGDPVFHDREVAEDTGPADTGATSTYAMGAPEPAWSGYDACSDYLEVPVTVHFSSDDGSFDETVAVSLMVEDPTLPSMYVDLDVDALGGSFVFTEIDPAEWDEVSLQLENRWGADGVQGQVSMQASRVVSTGPTGVAEAMVGPVLSWPVLE